MSQKTEPKFLILGAVSSALIATVCTRTLSSSGAVTGKPYYLIGVDPFRFVIYFFWLLIQVVKSALSVARVAVLDYRFVEPSIAWFRAEYDNPAARALLANSITLTPGTITIDITDDGVYSVQALTPDVRNDLLDGSMQAKVAWVYHETIDFAPLGREEVLIHAAQARASRSNEVRKEEPR